MLPVNLSGHQMIGWGATLSVLIVDSSEERPAPEGRDRLRRDLRAVHGDHDTLERRAAGDENRDGRSVDELGGHRSHEGLCHNRVPARPDDDEVRAMAIDPVEKRIGRAAVEHGVRRLQAAVAERLHSPEQGILGLLDGGRLDVGRHRKRHRPWTLDPVQDRVLEDTHNVDRAVDRPWNVLDERRSNPGIR